MTPTATPAAGLCRVLLKRSMIAECVDERVGEDLKIAVVVEHGDHTEPEVPQRPGQSGGLLPRFRSEARGPLRLRPRGHGRSRGPEAVALSIANTSASPAVVSR